MASKSQVLNRGEGLGVRVDQSVIKILYPFTPLFTFFFFCDSVCPFSEAEPIYIHFLMYCKTFKFFDAVLLMNFQANCRYKINFEKKRILSKTFLRKRYDASVK